jgi:hypothetical protein
VSEDTSKLASDYLRLGVFLTIMSTIVLAVVIVSELLNRDRIKQSMEGEPDYRMTSDQLWASMLIDRNKFIEKYDGRVIALADTVIANHLVDYDPRVFLGSDWENGIVVTCNFDIPQDASTPSIGIGEHVVIRGVLDVRDGLMYLNDCRLDE